MSEPLKVWLRCLQWAPLVAALVHIFEEFVWPGGFMAWYRRYRGPATKSVTPRFLVAINLVLLLGCWNAGAAFVVPQGLLFWIAISALLASNWVWHLWASLRSHSFSPGTITGMLLYVPPALGGTLYLLRTHSVMPWKTALAFAIGASYPAWSALFHRPASANHKP